MWGARILLLHTLAVLAGAAIAGSATEPPPDAPLGPEPHNTGWSFYIDNDAFTAVNRDQQYTGGFALTLSGQRAVEYQLSLDPALEFLDRITRLDRLYSRSPHTTRHSIEFGVTSFTPDDIDKSEPIFDDHPYVGLVFFSNTQQTVLLQERVSYQTSLALGLLGTDVPKGLQNVFHEVLGSQKPRGWDNQISDGGEPTFLYVVNRQESLWLEDDRQGVDFDVRSTFGGSIGYTTQLTAGINWRAGRIRTPWWGFNPDFGEYINLGTPVARSNGTAGSPRELFVWGNIQVRQRFYNAFLEGQFRDSEVTFDRDELDSTLGQLTLGITLGLRNGMRVTAAIRARERELEQAEGVDPVWGSLIISRAF